MHHVGQRLNLTQRQVRFQRQRLSRRQTHHQMRFHIRHRLQHFKHTHAVNGAARAGDSNDESFHADRPVAPMAPTLPDYGARRNRDALASVTELSCATSRTGNSRFLSLSSLSSNWKASRPSAATPESAYPSLCISKFSTSFCS